MRMIHALALAGAVASGIICAPSDSENTGSGGSAGDPTPNLDSTSTESEQTEAVEQNIDSTDEQNLTDTGTNDDNQGAGAATDSIGG